MTRRPGTMLTAGWCILALWLMPGLCGEVASAETADELDSKGQTAYRSGKYSEAVRFQSEALSIDPERHSSRYRRGVSLYHLGQYSPALADFQALRRVRDLNHLAFYHVGLIHSDRGDHVGALLAFQEALRIKPDKSYALNAARSARALDDKASAIIHYQDVLVFDGKNLEARSYIETTIGERSIREEIRKQKGTREPGSRQSEDSPARDATR
jgi:tetratricopeptide (TPR) repeat protein